ncbi:MAG: endolytic transglycosylase MltG [Alphaproteobacteria bacterium]|nr:endolytic transglycosylase MltG [Alphaproteobacteria bacterium]
MAKASKKILKRLLKKHTGFVIFLLLVVIGVFSLFGYVTRKSVLVTVAPGATVSDVANVLKKNDLIDSASSFKLAVRGMGGRIQVGQYEIPRGASAWRIAKMLVNGDVATVKILIPEGLTLKQIRILLADTDGLAGDVECGVGAMAPVCTISDGDIFPDTYRVARGTQRLAVLDLARRKMEQVKTKFESRRLPKPLKTWNDVVTLASIVQKETPRASEMPIVASVYLNRLRSDMRLQADPTVVYVLTDGLGDMQGEPLLSGHLKLDSPYNTYRNKGLPPGPIANVGAAAIKSVLNPADTNYLFFVADGNGGHRFSNTYEEHLKNHADWREIKNARN